MIYRDEELQNKGIELYRIDSWNDIEEMRHVVFDSNDIYEACKFVLAKYENEYYIFGASRNSDYKGYKITRKAYQDILFAPGEKIRAEYIAAEYRMFG